MRSLLRKLAPDSLLQLYRKRIKRRKSKELLKSRENGDVISQDDLLKDFRNAGIIEGDSLLVHASLSNIGFVENGASSVVDALLEAVGENGNLLMPTSPNAKLQLDYVRKLEVFDVENDSSKLGAISEYFRKLPQSKRSAHPTEPVSCVGPKADYFTADHFGCLTPYTEKSPFYRISEIGGKILYLGVTFDNSGTNLHTLEDAIDDFVYPVYYPEVFEIPVKFVDGSIRSMKTKVHNPEQSAKRKCDGLIPLFKEKGVLSEVKIGKAKSLLVDAKALFDCMLEEYNSRGVTMYTPEGNER